MKKSIYWLIVLLVCSITAQGLASEITIWDNQGVFNEDQEVEPGASTAPGWDLEGMFYDDGILSIVGEWNFLGELSNIGSGDIFISTSGPVTYGNAVTLEFDSSNDGTILNNFGYNYVFDVDWEHFTYNDDSEVYTGDYTLWQIDRTSNLNPANQTNGLYRGSPVSYAYGGTTVGTGNFSFSTIQNSGFENTPNNIDHYIASGFDLSDISDFDNSFIAHFTQECGNDVIMGQVPEPATMLLLGMGLLGIGAIGRKLPLKAD